MVVAAHFAESTDSNSWFVHKAPGLNGFSRPGNMEQLTFARIEVHVPGLFPTLKII